MTRKPFVFNSRLTRKLGLDERVLHQYDWANRKTISAGLGLQDRCGKAQYTIIPSFASRHTNYMIINPLSVIQVA